MSDNCIFEYKTSPSWGFTGSPGASSISVYSCGLVVRREYLFGEKTPNKEKTLATVPELAREIENIISRHAADLETIPDRLNNGTRDGSIVSFRFGDKLISTCEICRADPEEIRQRNPMYYARYAENMAFENLVLDIYNEIAREINAHCAGAHLEIM